MSLYIELLPMKHQYLLRAAQFSINDPFQRYPMTNRMRSNRNVQRHVPNCTAFESIPNQPLKCPLAVALATSSNKDVAMHQYQVHAVRSFWPVPATMQINNRSTHCRSPTMTIIDRLDPNLGENSPANQWY